MQYVSNFLKPNSAILNCEVHTKGVTHKEDSNNVTNALVDLGKSEK